MILNEFERLLYLPIHHTWSLKYFCGNKVNDEFCLLLSYGTFPVPIVAANKRFLVKPNFVINALQELIYLTSCLELF